MMHENYISGTFELIRLMNYMVFGQLNKTMCISYLN